VAAWRESEKLAAQILTGQVPLNYPLQPGDTVKVKERWF